MGDRLIVCDGAGKDHHCTVTKVTDRQVEAEVFETVPCPGEPSVHVTVLAGLPKGDRADFIVQKCTEAGASEILFFPCHRCVARLTGPSEKKVARWQRIAEEAAKQSGPGHHSPGRRAGGPGPGIQPANATDLPLFMYETGEQRKTLKDVLENAGTISSAAVITGPEGGFEPYEAQLAEVMKLHICSMGPRIFRCETAPMAALAAIMYATGNM